MFRYYIIYKPYNVLSQFTSGDGKKTLKNFFSIPSDVYPVGRLDYDSEGLLILTDDHFLNHQLLHPVHEHEREYIVQVEGNISVNAVEELKKGVLINLKGKRYTTKKCFAEKIEQPPFVPERIPPVRFRKNVPDSWLRIILTEGKNRQVRKMAAKAGFPTLRLIRYRIEGVTLSHLQPGEMKSLSRPEIYNLLKIHKR
ncbi:MAG TPA: pseudouridine synthase [Chitinophagaceae bacterium]|nr:pseudouridine synthase [Chitinophagaceae bacterium]